MPSTSAAPIPNLASVAASVSARIDQPAPQPDRAQLNTRSPHRSWISTPVCGAIAVLGLVGIAATVGLVGIMGLVAPGLTHPPVGRSEHLGSPLHLPGLYLTVDPNLPKTGRTDATTADVLVSGMDQLDLSRQSAQYSDSWENGDLQNEIGQIPLPFRDVTLNPAQTKILIQNTVSGEQIVYDFKSNYYRIQATKGAATGKYLSSSDEWVNPTTASEQNATHFNNTGDPLNVGSIKEMNLQAEGAFFQWWDNGSYEGETAAARAGLEEGLAAFLEADPEADDEALVFSASARNDHTDSLSHQ
jgi:hypothetical protein